MNILIVGAGAIGQVFGYHLSLSGAEVSFFIKEKYKEKYNDKLQTGLLLYSINKKKYLEFRSFKILTTFEEVKQTHWDQVYLCIPSTGLSPNWLEDFRDVSQSATLVSLQPGIEDQDLILKYYPRENLVTGMIAFASYDAPLPNETEGFVAGAFCRGESRALQRCKSDKIQRKSCVAYWFPPLSQCFFTGARAYDVVSALKAGHLPAKTHKDVIKQTAFLNAVFMVVISALEQEGWSIKKFCKNRDRLNLVDGAFKEVLLIVAKKLKLKKPLSCFIFRTCYLKIFLKFASGFSPFPFEELIQSHFTKVGAQTRLMMQTYVKLGKVYGLKTLFLEQLVNKER